MKYKLYNIKKDNKFSKLKNSVALESFEIQPEVELSAGELLKKKFDVIELDPDRYAEFREFLPAVEWKTNHIRSADCLIYKNNIYKPYNILADTIIRILKKNVGRVNSQLPVIVIGDYHFIFSVVSKLALSGFIEIIVAPVNAIDSELEDLKAGINSLFFNLNMKIVAIGDITSAEQNAFLMISNFPKEKNTFAYDLLIYFNYLSEGAIFIDCNSINDASLVEDARKAEIYVIDEVEVLEHKYDYLKELLKISP